MRGYTNAQATCWMNNRKVKNLLVTQYQQTQCRAAEEVEVEEDIEEEVDGRRMEKEDSKVEEAIMYSRIPNIH